MNQLVIFTDRAPALVTAAGERAQTRFWEFFVSNIRNPHAAPTRSVQEFLACCEQGGVISIAEVEKFHMASYVWTSTLANQAYR